MAITNSEAVTFSDEKLRPVADLLAQLYNLGKSVEDEWIARNMNALIPNDALEVLHDSAYGTDGTDGDGRPVVTGQDLTRVITQHIRDFVDNLEANNDQKLKMILAVAVNTRRN